MLIQKFHNETRSPFNFSEVGSFIFHAEKSLIAPTNFGGWSYKLTPVCLCFWLFLQNGSKELPNFLHGCGGQQGALFELDGFSKKSISDYKGLRVPF